MTVRLLVAILLFSVGCIRTAEKRSTRRPAADDEASEDQGAKPKKKKKPADEQAHEDPDDLDVPADDEREPEDDKPKDEHTNGSGGPKGEGEARSAGGLSFQYAVPEDNQASTKAHGLLVLLHGSGASNYRQFVRQMRDVGDKAGLILVSVLAPNGSGWNEGREEQAADLLHDLIQRDLYPKYNIDKKKVLFSGQSSGGGFLGSHFVALHAKDYKGGAFLQCGAAPPRVAFTADEETKKNFRLHFEITSGDPIWPDSYARAVKAYRDAGMELSRDESKRGGHCAFDQQQVILDHLDFVLGKQG